MLCSLVRATSDRYHEHTASETLSIKTTFRFIILTDFGRIVLMNKLCRRDAGGSVESDAWSRQHRMRTGERKCWNIIKYLRNFRQSSAGIRCLRTHKYYFHFIIMQNEFISIIKQSIKAHSGDISATIAESLFWANCCWRKCRVINRHKLELNWLPRR